MNDNININFTDIQSIEEFMKTLETNPDLIDNLSKERLDILTQYYIERIQSNDKKIEELKAKLNKN